MHRQAHRTPPRRHAPATDEARYRCEGCDTPAARDAICERCGHSAMLDMHHPHDVQYRTAQRAMQQARRRTRLESSWLVVTSLILSALMVAGLLVANTPTQLAIGCVLVVGLLSTMRFFP